MTCIFTTIYIYTYRSLFLGLLYGSVWWNLPTGQRSAAVSGRLGLLFLNVFDQVIFSFATIALIFKERKNLNRELENKSITPTGYWLSVWIPQAIIFIPVTLLLAIIVYFMATLRNGFQYFITYYFILLMVNYNGMFIAILTSSLTSSIQSAVSVFSVILVVSLLYMGFLIEFSVLDDWQEKWIPYLNFMRYAYQGLCLNELDHNGDVYNTDYVLSDNVLKFRTVSLGSCVGLLVLFMLIYALLSMLANHYVKY